MKNLIMHTDTHQQVDYFKVATGVWGLKIVFVNIYMISSASDNDEWVLIDTGVPGSSKKIIRMAGKLFANIPPSAIILTHGHFDHTGSLRELLERWPVPVYAHRLEMPFLTGKAAYPPPDPSVGGGLMSSLSWIFPKGPFNPGMNVRPLPGNGRVPSLAGWKYYHTPGHAPGHISLFREQGRILIAGDAFVTTNQESAFASITQKKQLSGPPKYYTNNWLDAEKSVLRLAELQPRIAATGHGSPMKGQELRAAMKELSENFKQRAVPKHSRYAEDPGIGNDNGTQYIPPKPFDPLVVASIFALAAMSAYTLFLRFQKKRRLE